MCNFLSLIVTKEGDVFYDETTDSHEKIISDHKLIDDTNDKYKRQFVRVEITPPDNDVFKPVSEWNFKLDEGEIPLWWRVGLEKASRAVCTDYINKIVFENKDGIEIKNGRAFVKKCSTVTAYGISTVTAYDSSTVTEIKGDAVVIDRKKEVPIIFVANKKIKIAKDKK
jgi:hypothetical protein